MVGPPSFEYDLYSGECAIEWRNWLRGFELFVKANKIEDDAEKALLHYAGSKVQKVYFNLPQSGKQGPLAEGYGFFQQNEYHEAIMRLENFFAPKRNTTYERHVFRRMKQESDEKIEMFTMRLRTQTDRCEFNDQIESNIKDQLTEGCSSGLLRRKILERGEDDFDAILKLAKVIEAVDEQQKIFDRQENRTKISETAEEVNKISVKCQPKGQSSNNKSKCKWRLWSMWLQGAQNK